MPFFLNLEDDFKQKVSFDSSLKIASKGSRDSLLDQFINCYDEPIVAMLAPAQQFDCRNIVQLVKWLVYQARINRATRSFSFL